MKDQYIKLLKELIKFKSISTDPQYKSEMKATADWLVAYLKENGLEAQLLEGKTTNPYVFGHYHVDDKAETVMIYGHYDVQPAALEDGWKSEPFELTERDGRLYARGAIDNKGQFLIHMFTVVSLIKEGKLKYNVKFFIEGNEETGNEEISELLKSNKELLATDYVMVSDGEISANRPTLDVGFRGLINFTIKYKSANNNLHSGLYGGAVPSATMELATLISKFYGADNKVAIPGFYDGVDEVSADELENNKSIPFSMEEITRITGVKTLKKEEEYDFYTQTGLRPSLTVTGFKAGYTDEGYSNIVTANAFCKVNVRLVNSQDPKIVAQHIESFIKKETPDYIDAEVSMDSLHPSIKIDRSSPKLQEVVDTMEKAYGDKVVYKFVGGGIPIINDFKNVMGIDTISASLANEDCNMHGVDENFDLELVEKALNFSQSFFTK
ncbi:MAG: dipeptidase [Candidatus Dojkabacteria bacterium]